GDGFLDHPGGWVPPDSLLRVQVAEEVLERGHAASVRLGAARLVALGEHPVQEPVERLRRELPDGRVEARPAAKQVEVALERLDRVRRRAIQLEVGEVLLQRIAEPGLRAERLLVGAFVFDLILAEHRELFKAVHLSTSFGSRYCLFAPSCGPTASEKSLCDFSTPPLLAALRAAEGGPPTAR